jgi:hypothetical protein
MPETIPISPGLISTRASEAPEESIRASAGVRSARPREGRLRRSGAAISSELYNGEAEGNGGVEAGGLRFCAIWSDREKIDGGRLRIGPSVDHQTWRLETGLLCRPILKDGCQAVFYKRKKSYLSPSTINKVRYFSLSYETELLHELTKPFFLPRLFWMVVLSTWCTCDGG